MEIYENRMALKDHLNKLEYFCKVAESGSIQKASKKIGISQPQLSRVVKFLEEELEKQLIIRIPSGIQLTLDGQKLYESSIEIIKLANNIEKKIKYNQAVLKGEIRIGTYDSIARYFFPDFIRYIKTTAPDLSIHLETGKSDHILEKLKKQQLDMAIIVSEAKKLKPFHFRPIYQDSFGLYRSPTQEEDFNNKLIYFSFPQNETEKAMKHFNFNETILCDNLETVRSLTEQSMGVGLLPHRVAKESVLVKKLVPFKHPKIKNNAFDFHDIFLCHLKNVESNEIDFVVSESERFLSIWSEK
jgi:LysR family hydrogen peroxide-inducible transcriptional activator